MSLRLQPNGFTEYPCHGSDVAEGNRDSQAPSATARTGMPWRDFPERYGAFRLRPAWPTAAGREVRELAPGTGGQADAHFRELSRCHPPERPGEGPQSKIALKAMGLVRVAKHIRHEHHRIDFFEVRMTGYALENSWDREKRRLSRLEQYIDPMTQLRFKSLGLAQGAWCLEVGAGGRLCCDVAIRTSGPGRHRSCD